MHKGYATILCTFHPVYSLFYSLTCALHNYNNTGSPQHWECLSTVALVLKCKDHILRNLIYGQIQSYVNKSNTNSYMCFNQKSII